MKARTLEENIVKMMMLGSLALVFLALAGIILVVAMKGLSSLNLSMILETPKGGYYLGKEGGIANAIVGSLYLMAGATVISLVISLPVALALQREYPGRRFADFTRLIMDVLWGTPSIVYGAFGFVIMVFLGIRASLLGGIIVLSLLMIPIMSRAMDEAIRLVPFEIKEMSYALGATKVETTWAVVLRQAFPGLCTAVILAFGRGIGDAASILFTAGYTDEIPRSLTDPVASLPLAVFFQAGTPVPEVQARAFTAALILLFIVMVINIIARILGWRFSKNIVR
ncbi:MAG: phosphate ABC transporter permease PstA [Deltaproteobacteria bacterium]|nr:phosphate ABC transporter permease PstA [Deltaproteobacteria bacterium]